MTGKLSAKIIQKYPDSKQYYTKKSPAYCRTLLFLLGYPDSNQERQDQNLQCYHYTIAQYGFLEKQGQRYILFMNHQNIL